MDFQALIKFLLDLGLSPLNIALVVFCILLYRKTQELDTQLHDCLAQIIDNINVKGD